MKKIKFCPYCGNVLKNAEAKFCGKCGEALVMVQEGNEKKEVLKESSSQKEHIQQPFSQTKEGAKEAMSQLKKATEGSSEWSNKAKNYIEETKQNPTKKQRMIKVVGGLMVIFLLFFGWNWFSNKDYKQAMANGDSYFSKGEFGKAVEFYQQAGEEKPGNKRATEMREYSQDLSQYWVQINEDDFPGSRSQAVEEIETKANEVKDKKIKEKYTEAADYIKNSQQYQLEERIGNKYKDAYDMD